VITLNKDEIKIIGVDVAKTTNRMDDNLKEFYKKYPDKFIEEFLDLKLYWYQKVILRQLVNKKDK